MHTSEIRWQQAAANTSAVAGGLVDMLGRAEESYNELLEAFQYAGNTNAGFAELLFYGTNSVNVPTAAEVEKATDLRNALVVGHDLFTAANFPHLRRMS